MRIFTRLLFTAITILFFAAGYSQISLPLNTIVNEDFNSIGATATATLPANWRMSPSGNAVGTWAAGVSATTQAANSGLPSAGGRYNFATTAGIDRAVGFITDGTYNTDNAVMAYYKNTTGASVNAVTVSFAVERYVVNTGNFSLSFASSADGITWTPQSSGDISTGNFATGTAAGSFGAPQTITRTATINTIVPINGDIYFRWTFTTTNAASQGLGLDNVAVFAGTATPVLAAKLKDTQQVNNVPPANQFNDGDVIRYVTTIKNTGTGNAANVQLNEPAPSNTTFVGGSLKTSAVAVDDNYTAAYNTVLNGTTLLANDFGVPLPTAVIAFGTTSNPVTAAGTPGVSDAGATVTVNANGAFSYTPVTGFTGTDQFKYITGNGNLPNNDAVVTINVAPAASADVYTVVGNTQLVADGQSAPTTPFTASATNILTNDGGIGLTVTAVTNTATTNGGSITIDAAGKFTYTPPVGFTGTDIYTYTVTSNNIAATATITFNVANMVWYVNNTYAGANGAADGRSYRPFTNMSAATAPSLAGQIIYVHTGSGNTINNAVLKTGQTLRGAGSVLTVGALNVAAGTNPTLSGTVTLANNVIVDGFDMNTGTGTAITSSGATGVTVNVGNITTSGAVNAVTLSTTTGSVIIAGGSQTNSTGATFNIVGGTVSLTYSGNAAQANPFQPVINVSGGHAIGTITFQTGTLSATDGTGLQFNNADGIYNFNGTTTLSGIPGIDILNGSSGTYTFGTGTSLTKGSTAGGRGFNLTSSNAAVIFNGSMNFASNNGSLVNIVTHTGGDITFNTGELVKAQSSISGSGINISAVTGGIVTFNNPTIQISQAGGAGDAISLVNNTNGTINFTLAAGGTGMNLITLFGGIGFNATGGGTISVTGTQNTITTGAGTAGLSLNIANTTIGAGGLNFSNVICNTANTAINLTNVTGTGSIIINTGTLTGGTGPVFNVTGGNTNITYGGTISQANAQRIINIANATGGTILFSGALTGTATNTGINLATNTGATINFTGVITLDGTTSGFTATGGGTVSATNTANTIGNTTAPTATSLNVTNTNIGLSGLRFQKISSNGGSGTGIILDNTGTTASFGGLTVNGDGTNTTSGGNSTGGIISGKSGTDGSTTTGIGIYLNSTRDVVLRRMTINGINQNFGIRGSAVTNFTLEYSTVGGTNGTNDALDEGSISFTELTGSAPFTSDNISGGWEDNMKILNTTGTLNRATFTSVTFGANSSTFGNSAMNIQLNGTGTLNLTVQNSFFTSSRSHQFQYLLNGNAAPVGNLLFTGNTMSNSQAQINGVGAIFVTSGGGGNPTLTYTVSNNTIRDASGNAINITKGSGTGNFSGTLNANTIGLAGVANSGSAQGSGLTVFHLGGGTHTTRITNNIIKQVNGLNGILLQIGDNTSGGSGSLQATVTGNSVKQLTGFALHGFELNCGTTTGDAHFVCLGLSGNDFAGSGLAGNGGFDVRLRQRFLTSVRLPGYGGANNDGTAVGNFIVANNTTNGAAAVSAANTVGTGGGGFVGGAACQQPL